MKLPAGDCVLIADTRRESFALLAGQWAALSGMRCWRMELAAADFSAAAVDHSALLVLSCRALLSFNPAELRAMKAAVWSGASLYVRGSFPVGRQISLAPFAAGAFTVECAQSAEGYRLANDELIPCVLRNELIRAAVDLPAARVANPAVRPLASRNKNGAAELPFIFALSCGAGIVIYDLLPDETPAGAAVPIVKRLADPAGRCFEVGAMAAINRAVGRPHETVSAYNLTLDDRPCNLDYFNDARVARWLAAIERVCPGTHVDFAWTPQHTHPSPGYVGALKRFNAGFVWHGLHQHVDHRQLKDPGDAHRKGMRLVQEISRRYSVRFQPVMILPFPEVDLRMLDFLRNAGFVASVFHADPRQGIDHALPPFMHYSTPCHDLYLDHLPALRRYLVAELTRDSMLANAALDLPIIAAAHPFEVGLRRCAALYQPWEPPPLHFDEVLKFAREKSLRPLPLEKIAHEMIARPLPSRAAIDLQVSAEGSGIAV